jgi:hypothetical protein
MHFGRKTARKRPFERLRHEWEDNIKQGVSIKRMGLVWLRLHRGGGFVRMVIYLQTV